MLGRRQHSNVSYVASDELISTAKDIIGRIRCLRHRLKWAHATGNRSVPLNAIAETEDRPPSERPASPTQVTSEVGVPSVKEEVPSSIAQVNHEEESSAVSIIKLEVDDYSLEQEHELQKQDDIFRAINHVKRCMSPMRVTDNQVTLAKKARTPRSYIGRQATDRYIFPAERTQAQSNR